MPHQVNPVPHQVNPVPDQVNPVPDQINPVPDHIDPEPDQIDPVPDQVNPVPDQINPVPDQIDPEPDQIHPVPDPVAGNRAAGVGTQSYLSRPQIAQLAGVSEQTIDRDVKKHQMTAQCGPNGVKLYPVQAFLAIGRLTAADLPDGLSPSQAVEVLRLQKEVRDLQLQLGLAHGRLSELEHRCRTAEDQLTIKDAQLTASDAITAQALAVAASMTAALTGGPR